MSVCVSVTMAPSVLAALCVVEFVIEAFECDELLVSASLDHLALLDDGDTVGVLDGGQTMRDHDAGATLTRTIQRLLHHLVSKVRTTLQFRPYFLSSSLGLYVFVSTYLSSLPFSQSRSLTVSLDLCLLLL